MTDTRFIRSIKLSNLLSFGPQGLDLELKPLNVLIGTNASGKTNLMEAVSLLQAAPTDIVEPIREGGGTGDWLWKGIQYGSTARIEANISLGQGDSRLFNHKIAFWTFSGVFRIFNEEIGYSTPDAGETRQLYSSDISQSRTHAKARPKQIERSYPYKDKEIVVNPPQFNDTQSVLSQRAYWPQDAVDAIATMAMLYSRIRIYRDWVINRDFPPKQPASAEMNSEFLLDDVSNLAVVLERLQDKASPTYRLIKGYLSKLYPMVADIYPKRVSEGQIQLYMYENGLREAVPAVRMSDGLLRFLCLLTILLHPSPAPLICIDEPEIGLHPDAIHVIGKLIKEASTRTQLIVATHSDLLVSELSDTPESVIVCERDENGTRMERLDPRKLEVWLKDYSLGHIWLQGELGGTL